jgi:hypothetical protein
MNTKKLLAALFLGSLLAAGCGGSNPPPGVPYLELNNDTYDHIDVYIDGAYMDTLHPGDSNSYDMDTEANHHVVLTFAGDRTQVLNDQTLYFPGGTTTSWDVYTNAPVVLLQNNYALGDLGSECLTGYVDGAAASFAIGSSWSSGVAFDATVCQGETGFYLVDIDNHRVVTQGSASGDIYHDDTRFYADTDHVVFTAP